MRPIRALRAIYVEINETEHHITMKFSLKTIMLLV